MTEAVKLDFAKMDGLLPAIVQDAASGEVLMVGFMNEASYAKTLESIEGDFVSSRVNDLFDIERRILQQLLGLLRKQRPIGSSIDDHRFDHVALVPYLNPAGFIDFIKSKEQHVAQRGFADGHGAA